MAQPLFLPSVNPDSFFEKEASIAKMPDDEKNWPSQILSTLHEQLPFLSDFSVNIMLQRMEPEAGFAFGYALVLSKSDPRVSTESKNAESGVRIPIIVADRQLQPFHTFEINGKVFPLTPERIAAAMMNPAMFDGPATKPRTQKSLVDQLYPPYQQRQGFGLTNTGTNTGGISKVSSKDPLEMTPSELRTLATLRATEKSDKAVRDMSAAERAEGALRSSIVPVAAGGLIGAGKKIVSTPGDIKTRLGGALLGAGSGALTGAGISAANLGVQGALRAKRETQRKKLGLNSENSIKEALAQLDFSPGKRIPSSMVLKGQKVKLAPGVAPASLHFFQIPGTKFVVGVDAKLAAKLGTLTDQRKIRQALVGPMRSEIRAARAGRSSPGMFLLFTKTKDGYAYQTPSPTAGIS